MSEQSYNVSRKYDEHTGVLVFRSHVLYYLSDTDSVHLYGTQRFATDLVLFCRNVIITDNSKVTINHCATGGLIQNH